MDKIKVPDIPHPTAELCYKQSAALVRCDRKAGHGGMHTWQMWAEIERLRDKLVDAGVSPE
jgi:hypothetical protein